MPSLGFEPMISAGERQQTYALDRAATETGIISNITVHLFSRHHRHKSIYNYIPGTNPIS
jgi:hypothetical protein